MDLKHKIKVMIINATIKSVFSLLMNRMSDETLEGLRTRVHAPKDREITPEQDAAPKIYRRDGDKGPMGIPSINLYAALKHAGRSVQYSGKKNISTAEGTLMYSFMSIKGDFLPFKNVNENGDVPWVADKRRGTCQDIAVCIVRPLIAEWELDVTFQVNGKMVKEKTIRDLVEKAGMVSGLGDFRPNKGGPFGRFAVAKWEVTMEDSDKGSKAADEGEEEEGEEASSPAKSNGRNRVANSEEIVTAK